MVYNFRRTPVTSDIICSTGKIHILNRHGNCCDFFPFRNHSAEIDNNGNYGICFIDFKTNIVVFFAKKD